MDEDDLELLLSSSGEVSGLSWEPSFETLDRRIFQNRSSGSVSIGSGELDSIDGAIVSITSVSDNVRSVGMLWELLIRALADDSRIDPRLPRASSSESDIMEVSDARLGLRADTGEELYRVDVEAFDGVDCGDENDCDSGLFLSSFRVCFSRSLLTFETCANGSGIALIIA